jgi:hypothetical protein
MVDSFLSQIPWKDNKFLARLLILIFLTIYVFTTVITITPGHFLAILLILALLMNYDKNEVFSNEQILIKLENLTTPDYAPRYLYLDSDLIILFDNIKLDFYKYNPRAFTSSLKACDNLLLLRYESELQLLPQPKVKNILINFPEESDEVKGNSDGGPKKVGLSNALQTFEAAEIQYQVCINYLHSLIIAIPSNRTLHQKHSIVMEKADILLKRNLDIIYHIYNDSRELGQLELTRYHTQQPINTITEDALTSSFNFIL